MEIPSNYIDKFAEPTTLTSERQELLKRFLDRRVIKVRDRKTKELRLATARELAVLLGHVPTSDLHTFYRQCEEARSFSRYFWWAIKPK